MTIINNKYNIGEIIYLVTDEGQMQRMVTAIHIKTTDHSLSYEVTCGAEVTFHYECEISKEKNYSTVQ